MRDKASVVSTHTSDLLRGRLRDGEVLAERQAPVLVGVGVAQVDELDHPVRDVRLPVRRTEETDQRVAVRIHFRNSGRPGAGPRDERDPRVEPWPLSDPSADCASSESAAFFTCANVTPPSAGAPKHVELGAGVPEGHLRPA